MRRLLLLPLVALLVTPGRAEETDEKKDKNEDVVKATRYVVAATKPEEIEKYKGELLARDDLDWPSVKEGLRKGPYYRKPLVTDFGERHSSQHMGIQFIGADNKRRGFSLWIPKGYDPDQAALPVLFYLHHNASNNGRGSEIAGTALLKFKKLCDEHNILFAAPYTTAGAEWWTPEGKRLVEWTLREIKERYSIDENRIALLGAMDGGDSVWYLGQEMPGTWSCLMCMSGDPLDISAAIRPLYLGTLDRMDVLIGVPGKTNSMLGEANAVAYLRGLKPLFDQNMRVTTAIYTRAWGDFRYLPEIEDQIAAWALTKKRKPLPDEVDVETDAEEGQRSLWLAGHGHDGDIEPPHGFPTTRLVWKAPAGKEPDKKLGLSLQARPKWEFGMVITGSEHGAREANLFRGDVLLAVEGNKIAKTEDLKGLLKDREWDDDVLCVLAREVKASDLERQQKLQKLYLQKVNEYRSKGEKLPRELWKDVQEMGVVEEEEDDDDDGDTEIEISDGGGGGPGAGPAKKLESEETRFFVFERWIKLIRPESRKLIRADFGASWDPGWDKEGVRVAGVTPGTLADESGLRAGDLIVQVGADAVTRPEDVRKFFEGFKFEEEPEGERFVEITVKRPGHQGDYAEKSVRVSWDPPKPYRVDARWDKQENILDVKARHLKSFTVYFTDELIEPGKEFHLFINDVPYQDLVDPASAPDYPEVTPGSDPMLGDRVERMRKKRALVEGWTPDLAWAVDEALAARDRTAVFGAKRTFDVSAMKEGFAKAKAVREERAQKKSERIKEAFEKHASRD